MNQRVAAAMLEHLGFEVDVVADGAEAVEAAAPDALPAILMDCQLPGLDGYQATDGIRAPGGRRPAHADHRGHRLGHGRRPAAVPRRRHGRLPRQAAHACGRSAAVLDRCGPRRIAAVARPAIAARAAVHERTARSDRSRCSMPGSSLAWSASARRGRGPHRPAGRAVPRRLPTTRIVALREALAGDDAVAVRRSAHTLSGASANLGATDLARLCGVAGDARRRRSTDLARRR